jgi:anti-sigma regulatory factor (Ser/Thr protein kinase)
VTETSIAPVEYTEPVEIRVPAEPSFSRVLRLAASGMASLNQRSVDEIEDIKIAVSEIFLALIEHGGGTPVHIRFWSDADAFRMSGTTASESFDLNHPDLVLCRTVLQEVCTEHDIVFTDGVAEIRATIGGVAGG